MHASDATRRRTGVALGNGGSVLNDTTYTVANNGGVDKENKNPSSDTKVRTRRIASKRMAMRRHRGGIPSVLVWACVNATLAIAGVILLLMGVIRRRSHPSQPLHQGGAYSMDTPPRINVNMHPEPNERYHVPDHERHYTPKHAVPGNIGDKSPHFLSIFQEFKKLYPPDAKHDQLRLDWVDSIRPHKYRPIDISPGRAFDNILDCPETPTADYPRAYPTLDIINHWNPDDVTPPADGAIYQGICVFDYTRPGDFQKAQNYREAEVPFVVRNDPSVLRTVQRWNHPDYLRRVLEGEPHRAEFSHDNHFMYWQQPRNKQMHRKVEQLGWKPPTDMMTMTYDEWLAKANVTSDQIENEGDHWYFRLIGCGGFENCDKYMSEWLFDDLDFFFPRESLYIVKPGAQKGIHCRFGMKGVIAENHFDGSRNSIVVLGGERRYILSHPNECPHLALLPKGHPSARHSAVDWSNPDLVQFPQFHQALSNEIVLQAGDVLYLPTNWFHYIVSLGLNYQCNTRSGVSTEYMDPIDECGFRQ